MKRLIKYLVFLLILIPVNIHSEETLTKNITFPNLKYQIKTVSIKENPFPLVFLINNETGHTWYLPINSDYNSKAFSIGDWSPLFVDTMMPAGNKGTLRIVSPELAIKSMKQGGNTLSKIK